LYIPDAPESPMVFYQRGIALEDECSQDYELIDVVSAPLDRVNRAIERLYEDVLKTPNGMFGSFTAWADGDGWKSIPNTEKVLQAQVRATLVNAIPFVHASEEEMTAAGRFDIGLIQIRSNTKIYHGLIELKVLRKGRNSGKTLNDGVEQAYNYAAEVNATWTELVAFDMRDTAPDADPFIDLRSKAATLGVHLKSLYLFSTLDRYRSHTTAVALEA